MGADYPVYLPSATPYLRLRRQGASWPSGTLTSRPGAPSLQAGRAARSDLLGVRRATVNSVAHGRGLPYPSLP